MSLLATEEEAVAETSRLWAEFRLAVVGHLVVGDLDRGQRGAELKSLSAKKWKHPITGKRVTFGYSTIECWYYKALNHPDALLATLSKKPCGSGQPRSLSKQVCHYLASQAKRHASWSYAQHHRTLVQHMRARERGLPPGYSAVRRYLQSLYSSQDGTSDERMVKLERLVVHLRRKLIVESTLNRLLRVPELTQNLSDLRSSMQGWGHKKRLTFFRVSGTINPQAARNPRFALTLAFQRRPLKGGAHHTGGMAKLVSKRGNGANILIAPGRTNPRHKYWRSFTVSRATTTSIGRAGLE
jgi:hypothetical protein